MFEPDPKAQRDLKPGTLYAVAGELGWVYLGQVTTDKQIGFFQWRDQVVPDAPLLSELPIMSVVGVNWPSITRALRSGKWRKLGRFDLVDALVKPRPSVMWSAGTLQVSVFDGDREFSTEVDDPAIQDLEIAASWDAEDNIPERLTADFGSEPAVWHVGGTVARERRVKEEWARRAPDMPWHQLPPDWVWTE